MAINENDVRQWLETFLRTETKVTKILPEKPVFLQIDSFEVISLLLACEEEFHLGESISGDALTPMTFEEMVAFIASRDPA